MSVSWQSRNVRFEAVGLALSAEQEASLIEALTKSHSPTLSTFVRVAILTAMRSGEILSLTWGQVDVVKRVLTVGRVKTASGTGRQIPISAELFGVIAAHSEWYTKRFGQVAPEMYLFPYGKPSPCDVSRPTTTIKTAWNSLRQQAGVARRLHDLRHCINETC